MARLLTRLSFFIHQRNRHDHVVRNGEAYLQVGTEGELHSEEDVGKYGREFRICAGLKYLSYPDNEGTHIGTYWHQVQNNLL